MEAKRRIVVQALQTRDNQLIPVWDERVVFENSEMYGPEIKLKEDWRNSCTLVECIYDIKTKSLSIGIELDIYPDKTQYVEGESVYVETNGPFKTLRESVIKKVIYEAYDMQIMKGKKIEPYYLKTLKDVVIEPESMYALKIWKPYYILEDGTKIDYDYKLYHKV